jgi:hypothetical protein
MTSFQRKRVLYQGGFFVLFVFAPIFDLLRFDLTQGHLIVFGQPWTLGLDDYLAGRIDNNQMAFNILALGPVVLRLAMPAFLGGGNHQPTGSQGQRQANHLGQATGTALAS